MIKYRSNAKWDKGNGRVFTSQDLHDTAEQATAVCKMLERVGLGGEGKEFPITTWTDEIEI